MDPEKPTIGTHYFDEKANVLYDLLRSRVLRMKITQTIPGADGQPETTREYSVAELHIGVNRKLLGFRDAAEASKNAVEAEDIASQDPDLVLVSFYTFLAAPGLSGMLSGFHNAWLHGFYVAKAIKNRGLVLSPSCDTMTTDERTFTEEKIREQGLEPYDPGKHGPAEGPGAQGSS